MAPCPSSARPTAPASHQRTAGILFGFAAALLAFAAPTGLTAAAAPPLKLSLAALPATLTAGQTVEFTAEPSRTDPNFSYCFFFVGSQDKFTSGWQKDTHFTHRFGTPESYAVYVKAAWVVDRVVQKEFATSGRTILKIVPASLVMAKSDPVIDLRASALHVLTEQPVEFTVSASGTKGPLIYTFSAGDDSKAVRQTVAGFPHLYHSAKRYTARAQLIEYHGPPTDTVEILVDAPNLQLQVAPEAPPSLVVALKAFGPAEDIPGLRYRFVFDDKLQTDWSDSPLLSRTYEKPGSHWAQAEVGYAVGPETTFLARSGQFDFKLEGPTDPTRGKEVTGKKDDSPGKEAGRSDSDSTKLPPATGWQRLPPWQHGLIYLAGASVLLLGLKLLPKPNPVPVLPQVTFHPKLDPRAKLAPKGKAPAINLTVRLNPKWDRSSVTVKTLAPKLIIYQRSTHE